MKNLQLRLQPAFQLQFQLQFQLRVRVAMAMGLAFMSAVFATGAEPVMKLKMRSATARGDKYVTTEKVVRWEARKTAIVICDMWDDHWCRSASRRVAELAGPLNDTVKEARARGVFVVHAPSSVTPFYEGTPQRELAKKAPEKRTPVGLAHAARWGTKWCWTDPKIEPVLPIDDSDMGCSCTGEKCTVREAWTRQISTLELAAGDAVTDDGQELWNLLTDRGIEHVIVCGVHLNMCVLGRPVGIRQLKYLGKDVALMRDMTDTMYNPERPPGVDHFTGTDLVIAHVERHWCPTFLSSDITGKKPFTFAEDRRSAAQKKRLSK